MSEKTLDTFEDVTPVELPADYKPAPKEKEEEGEEEVEKKEDKPELKEKTQVENLDEDEDGKEKKPEEKKVEKKEEKKEEKDEEEEKKPEEKKETDSKKIKVKDGDEAVELSENATVAVKIKGKKEFVTLKELKEEYSGKKAWGSKIEEVNNKNKDIEVKSKNMQAQFDGVKAHLAKVSELLDDEKSSPLEALYYLVDLSGRNVHNFNRRVHDYLAGEINTLNDMDDHERNAYWTNRELEYLKRNQASRDAIAEKARAEKERFDRKQSLRETQGVSEEQYDEAFDFLTRKMGYDSKALRPEDVVKYAVMQPHIDEAIGLCEQFEEDLTDNELDTLISTVAQTFQANPNISEEMAIRFATESLGWDLETEDEEIEELAKKTNSKIKKTDVSEFSKNRNPDHVESFNDFDEGTYGRA